LKKTGYKFGLRHEEHNVGDEEVKFLHIWIELQNIGCETRSRYLSKKKGKINCRLFLAVKTFEIKAEQENEFIVIEIPINQ